MSSKSSVKPDSPLRHCGEPESARTKVAEPAVAYVATTPQKRVPASHVIAGIPASEKVWQFAKANELVPHLETTGKILRNSFHQLADMRFAYDVDPEIENESWITIHAKVAGSLDELLREDWAYTRAVVRALPKDKLPLIHFSPFVAD